MWLVTVPEVNFHPVAICFSSPHPHLISGFGKCRWQDKILIIWDIFRWNGLFYNFSFTSIRYMMKWWASKWKSILDIRNAIQNEVDNVSPIKLYAGKYYLKVVTMVKKTGGLFSNSVCSRICFERGVINESSVTIIHWQDIRLYEYFPWGKKGWTSCKNINVSHNLWAWSRGTDSEESYENERDLIIQTWT